MKVMTVVGTRPEIIRLSRIISLLDETCSHILVNTGQNSDQTLNKSFFKELDIRTPDHELNCDASSFASFIASAFISLEPLLAHHNPDAFLVLGDTNSSLTSILAKRMQIPVFHLEAGNRAFDANIPEETNRRLLDHLADFNFPYSESARLNLLREGLHPRRILKSGSPLPEVLQFYDRSIDESNICEQLGVSPGEYFLVSAHRAENVDHRPRLGALLRNIESLGRIFDCQVLVSTHPRTRARMQDLPRQANNRVLFHEPFGFLDYMQLQKQSKCVISDSGTVSEEASIVGFPAVTLRGAMERPEALEAGVLVMTDVDGDLVASTKWAMQSFGGRDVPWDYTLESFSHRVVNAILSTAPLHRQWSGLYY